MSCIDKKLKKKFYFDDYDSLGRFISYFYQIKETINTKPKTILEIGIGNKTVCYYLKYAGFHVTTLDINKELNPDKVGDIRDIPFPNNQFDTVIACEILEHIPFLDLPKAFEELKRVSK